MLCLFYWLLEECKLQKQQTATQQITEQQLTKQQVTAEDVKKAYHFYAHFYYFIFGAPLEHGRRVLAKILKISPPNTILEVGVGTGMLLRHYPNSSEVTGIDICEDMLAVAQTRADALPQIAINLQTMDAENLTFADESFDCVVLAYVLSATPNPHKLSAEVRRVCKKNGTIYILNHFSGSGFWWLLEKLVANMANKIGFRSEFSYEYYVQNQPWKIIKTERVNLFGLSKFVVIKNV